MEKKSTGLTVSFIDKERHAVYLDFGGCSIVLAFDKERNDGIRNNLKDILIGSVINQSKDGTDTVRSRYTCQTKSRTHGDCDGQTGYTVEKLDAMVEAVILSLFARVEKMDKAEIVGTSFKNSQNSQLALLQKVKREYEKAEADLRKLKAEVVKAITGESSFTPDLLNSIIEDKERECQQLKEAYDNAQQEINNSEAHLKQMGKQYDNLLEWSVAYHKATPAAKKMIVSALIDRVDVYRGYKLRIKLNMSVEQFLNGLSELDDVTLDIPA